MPSVFLCSPYNSTLFTTCCEVAILNDQPNCPRCGLKIDQESAQARWEAAFGPTRRAMAAKTKAQDAKPTVEQADGEGK